MSGTAEITIESIASGGDGVGRIDRRVVFVPRSAPGDVGFVDVPATGRFARARFRELTVPSPERVQPPCVHYVRDRCGGCQLQHLEYTAQLRAKGRIVGDALQRIGKRNVPPPEVHPSELPWRYRRKLTLAIRRGPDGWFAGLHPFDAPGDVFQLEDCPITDARLVSLWSEVLRASSLFPDDARALRGSLRRDDEGTATLTIEGGRRWPASAEFFRAVPQLAALWWMPDEKPRRRLHARNAHAPGASFTQVNAAVAHRLQSRVMNIVAAHTPRTVVDGYSGVGDTATALAHTGIAVTAIELDADAAAWAAARLPAGSRVLPGRVEDLLGAALPADVVILNPPRAGVDRRVTEVLQSCVPRPKAVVYVSCDPATLARDVARMPDYRIATLECYDMFPQTAHVETVCELVSEVA